MTSTRLILKTPFLLAMCLFGSTGTATAQSCPPNIDFESGDFAGWTCYAGSTASTGTSNIITFNYTGAPLSNQHTINASNPGSGLDSYGDFPVNCPNGSGYSIKLGNDQAGTQAEGASYDFTIPANANIYNLIYNYAVVFQDPGHQPSEQPRLEIEVLNLSDGNLIGCSSFTFYASGTILPGFKLSTRALDNTPVWYKEWTAVSVNLDGLAGKTIRLFFKTADCTFRRHFGYAYIDVNTECSDKFAGAEFCPDDSVVFVTAPYGYAGYTWYNINFTQILGNLQTLSFDPPPAAGTSVSVILTPYEGYGCLDTLYTDLTNTLTYRAEAGRDTFSCNNAVVQLGVPPKAGWNYQWLPTTGLNNPALSNPLSGPAVNTDYVLTVTHNGGGCRTTDTATIQTSLLDNTLAFSGKDSWCLGTGDSAVLSVQPAEHIQWYRNSVAIAGATGFLHRVIETGNYHAVLSNNNGCVLETERKLVSVGIVPIVSLALNNSNQCLLTNEFIFSNNSNVSVGNMFYEWNTGDGNTFTSRILMHRYVAPGTYEVKLVVRSNAVCADSSSMTVNVYPNVLADFKVQAVCAQVPMLASNTTDEAGSNSVSYLWDFGNGVTSTLRNPPSTMYPNAGVYMVKLSVSSAQCPLPLNTLQRTLRIDKPIPAERYPVKYAVVNLPLSLRARSIGEQALWSPATHLGNATSYTPVFLSVTEQLYHISLKTISGCITVDTQLVKINKGIAIFVPNTFTPNADGTNDVLRPFTIGIKELVFFKIFNRWGQQIFQTSSINSAWDGRFKGSPVEMQTIVWMLEGIGVDNLKYTARGTTVVVQ